MKDTFTKIKINTPDAGRDKKIYVTTIFLVERLVIRIRCGEIKLNENKKKMRLTRVPAT